MVKLSGEEQIHMAMGHHSPHAKPKGAGLQILQILEPLIRTVTAFDLELATLTRKPRNQIPTSEMAEC